MTTNATTQTAVSHLARAPGKLILSGEHSIVYGAPAIAVAVEEFTTVSFTRVLRAQGLRTAFDNVSKGQFYPLNLLRSFMQGLDKRFEAFKSGDITVREILHRPDDLAVYSMASLLNYLPMPGVTATRRLPEPGVLSSESTIPTGAGMGSSAAVIAATFVLYEHLLGHVLTDEERFERVRFCERLQHGQGSAIDAATVVYGGVNSVYEDVVERLSVDEETPTLGHGWFWTFHGTPESMTGECVSQVSKHHADDQRLWEDFSDCTKGLQQALAGAKSPLAALRENHRLLTQIGVVPESAQSLIREIERMGGAAKISGAGAVRGDSAGILLAYLDPDDAESLLAEKFPDLVWKPLSIVGEGAHLMPKVDSSEVDDALPMTT